MIAGIKTWQDLQVGDRCKVFDSDSWQKTGDVGDNSQFWLEAEIIKETDTHLSSMQSIIDVKFNDGRISKGHFKRMAITLNP